MSKYHETAKARKLRKRLQRERKQAQRRVEIMVRLIRRKDPRVLSEFMKPLIPAAPLYTTERLRSALQGYDDRFGTDTLTHFDAACAREADYPKV